MYAAGQWHVLTATTEIDPSERKQVDQTGQTEGDRMKVYLRRHVEARAFNAAIRTLGVKQFYTPAELARPFVVIRAYLDAMADPDLRKLVLMQAADDCFQLFGGEQPDQAQVQTARRVMGYLGNNTDQPGETTEIEPPAQTLIAEHSVEPEPPKATPIKPDMGEAPPHANPTIDVVGRPLKPRFKDLPTFLEVVAANLPYFCKGGVADKGKIAEHLKAEKIPVWAHPDAWPSLLKRQTQDDEAQAAMVEVQERG